jgi:hypothetical protein
MMLWIYGTAAWFYANLWYYFIPSFYMRWRRVNTISSEVCHVQQACNVQANGHVLVGFSWKRSSPRKSYPVVHRQQEQHWLLARSNPTKAYILCSGFQAFGRLIVACLFDLQTQWVRGEYILLYKAKLFIQFRYELVIFIQDVSSYSYFILELIYIPISELWKNQRQWLAYSVAAPQL